jgi:hypothetical protein
MTKKRLQEKQSFRKPFSTKHCRGPPAGGGTGQIHTALETTLREFFVFIKIAKEFLHDNSILHFCQKYCHILLYILK